MITFNEWMAFRQTVPEGEGEYRFVGTYSTDSIRGISAGTSIDIGEALRCVPESFRMQFGGSNSLQAGRAISEQSREVVWITNKDIDVTYVFERS